MFEQLFRCPRAIKRKFNAPFLEDRLRYLAYRAAQGTTQKVLRDISCRQLAIIKYLNLKDNDHIFTFKELETAARCWANDRMLRLKGVAYATYKSIFIKHAKKWLRFLGRVKAPESFIPPQVIEYVDFMRKEQDLCETTICHRRQELQKFFSRIKEDPGQFLARLTPAQLDAIQIQKFHHEKYSKSTIQHCATTLRTFFRYAERQGWCRHGIADSIRSPRIYKHATLPSSPSWEDVQRLLKTTEGDSPLNIRNRAIILLLAVYGLRAGEVRRLRLDDIDWEHETFCVKRLKFGPIQRFPLVKTIKQALIRYLEKVRPQHTNYREIFLIMHPPFTPMKDLFYTVSSRWKLFNVAIKKHGPHSLRRACATRLINQGASLKTIADQLGHRDLETTRIYAKVDLTRLREVADFDLRGVL
jgi:site-specific recombinase XerD